MLEWLHKIKDNSSFGTRYLTESALTDSEFERNPLRGDLHSVMLWLRRRAAGAGTRAGTTRVVAVEVRSSGRVPPLAQRSLLRCTVVVARVVGETLFAMHQQVPARLVTPLAIFEALRHNNEWVSGVVLYQSHNLHILLPEHIQNFYQTPDYQRIQKLSFQQIKKITPHLFHVTKIKTK